MKCAQCPASAEEQGDLCAPCMMELAYRILAEAPAHRLYCEVCGKPYEFIEARVMRLAKNPAATGASHVTPRLCWICTRLHVSASGPESVAASQLDI